MGFADPQKTVAAPAMTLIVLNAIGMLFAVMGIVMQAIGAGNPGGFSTTGGGASYQAGTAGNIVIYGIGLLIGGFIIYGLMQMRTLRKRTLSMIAIILNMIPCFGSCWCLGLPFGIWALIVMSKPEVKAAFQD